MKSSNYTTSFVVDETPEEAFAAINNVRGWWSSLIATSTEEIPIVKRSRVTST